MCIRISMCIGLVVTEYSFLVIDNNLVFGVNLYNKVIPTYSFLKNDHYVEVSLCPKGDQGFTIPVCLTACNTCI